MSPAAESIHTIADLAHWSFAGTALAVVGHPIVHSLSPTMQNAALAELARSDERFRDWQYFKFDIAPADLPRALMLFYEKGFLGLNLTSPHKVLVLNHLAARDSTVLDVGAANTLRRTDAGWAGFNTDGHGLVCALQAELGAQLPDAAVVLLGAGGAARGAAVESLRRGCRELWIGNRTASNLRTLVADLRRSSPGLALESFDLAAPPADLPAEAIVINASALGLQPSDPAPIDLRHLPRPTRVFDMIYNPPSTALLRQAAQLKLPHANGLSMLVHQGARALELWSNVTAPVELMRRAARAGLNG